MKLNSRLSMSGGRSLPIILQSETAECGLACLAMVAACHGNRSGLLSLRQRFGVGARGCTLNQLIAIGTELGLTSRALRCEIEDLHQLACPAVLHWDFAHFVVLKRVRGRHAVIHDPAVGRVEVPLAELGRHFTGIALELAPGERFEREDGKSVPAITSLFTGIGSLLPFLFQVLLLSALLQIVALALPFYVQLVVDDVLVKRDEDLLTLLALGFGLVTLFSIATEAVRGYAGIYLSNQLAYILGARMFQHLLRLPAEYFSRRQVGDIVSRFGSLKPIQDFVTSSSITVILDGVLAVATLTLMFLYSPLLTAIVLAALGLYLVLQLALFKPLRHRSHEHILAEAQQETHFIETVRSMNAIKRFGIESGRSSDWQNRFADSINAGVKTARVSLWLQLAESGLTGISHVIVIYAGALVVLEGGMTIGMLYAFLAYRNHLTKAVTSLVNEMVRYLMLSLHLERLADIQFAEVEDTSVSNDTQLQVIGSVALKGAGFRYGVAEPWLFRNLDLTISAGDTVAIFGPSGCGKSTLMQCLLRSTSLTEGELMVDGKQARQVPLSGFRQQTAGVLQEDRLLAGTITSNIAFGEPVPDMERVIWAAHVACINAEIELMPMGYDSLVGEMGAAMSAGQTQRVLIARALYRQPRILFLDEGTAHLDEAVEMQVMNNLLALGITCIFVTHNRRMLPLADSVILRTDDTWLMKRVRKHRARAVTASKAA